MSSMTLTLALALGLFSSRDVGTTAMPLLKIAAGPRASAMGETFTALADDATAIFWNPAGLGRIKNLEFFLAHQEWFQDIRDEYASMVLPAGTGRLGLGLTYSGTTGIEVWGPDNRRGEIGTTSNHVGVLNAAYGAALNERYSVGAGAKVLYDHLGSGSSFGFGGGFDLGGMMRVRPDVSIGLSAQNLGAAWYRDNPYTWILPMTFRLGGAYQRENLNAAAELVLPIDNSPSLHLGGEYTALNILTFRAGFKTGPQDISTLSVLSGLTLGLGARLGRFAVDYAFVPYGTLGMTHRVGLRTVVPPRGFGSLRIVTIDSRTRSPLMADVEVSGTRDEKHTANEKGRVVLGKLPDGWVRARATYPGYAPAIDSIYALGDRDQVLTIALTRPGRGTIWGRLLDAVTRRNIGGNLTYRGLALGSIDVDSLAASFTIKDLLDGAYELTARGPTDDYIPQSCTVMVEPFKVTTRDFYLIRKRQKIILRGANFETGKADLLPEYLHNLDEAGRILQDNPTIIVELAGHTDPREINTPEFPSNWELSQGRAQAVRKYLIEKFRVKPERLVARGYADTQPIAPNDTPEGMARNRRTEFIVLEE
jgi:outer membrane protein OmpA-like peptidoglycan-associated protein